MVRKLRLAGIAAVVLLSFGACEVLFIGIFPSTAGQMTARADLSTLVSASPASTFNLAIVDAAGSEYVLLFSGAGFDASQAHIVVMGPELNVLTTFTNDELSSLSGGSFLSGQHAMTDVNGEVVIGGFRFTALPNGLAFAANNPVTIGPSVTGLPVYPRNEVNFSAGSGIFSWNEYDAGWGPISPRSVNLGMSSLSLSQAFTERDSGGMPDVFVMRDYSSSRTFFLLIPKSHIDGTTLPTIVGASDIFTVYGGAGLIIEKSDLEDSVGFSYAGIVAYDHQTDALIRFPLDHPDDVSSVPMKWTDGMTIAMGNFGNYVLVWDPTARVLTRYEPWW